MWKIKYVLFVTLLISVMLTGCETTEDDFQEVTVEDLKEKGVTGEETGTEKSIFIHVCGQVKNSGVYEFPDGSRIYEAVEAAGGFTDQAAAEALNQAQILEDGQQLYVPSKEELKAQETESGITSKGLVNINKATAEDLMTLPGVGEAKAAAIIQYREQQGGFKSIEEIMEIEGIKEGVFRKIEHQITVS